MQTRPLAFALLCAWSAPLAAQEPGPVSFATPSAVVWAERTQTLSFRVAVAAAEDRDFAVTVAGTQGCVAPLGAARVTQLRAERRGR
jgi:hypothetical protein